jgi:hypothetical protein
MRSCLMASAAAICSLSMYANAQLSGIYVEFYNPTAPSTVAPDGWQTFPGYPSGVSSGSNMPQP